MKSIPPSSSATRATTATAFATTWRSEASNPSSRRDRTVRRQSNTIGKPTSGATSSSDASIASSNSGASPPDTRKPRELTFRCYASQQRNSGSKPSTRPSLVHGVSLSLRGSGRLDTRLDTPPISFRHHPVPRIARAKEAWSAINAVDENRPGWIPFEWEEVRLEVMEALGRKVDAQAFRWQCFERTLNSDHLRAYLKRLPDFEEI